MSSTRHISTRFSLSIVFTRNDGVECNGSQLLPTVRVSTRLVSVLPVRKYTQWIPVSGQSVLNYGISQLILNTVSVDNCSAAHNLTVSLSTIFNGTILDTVANPHYQFRIELSPADPCHCLTVDSATGVIGNNIFNQWRDGSFWCDSNITQLCASSSENRTFYSALMSRNGSPSVDEPLLCDNSTDEDLISESY